MITTKMADAPVGVNGCAAIDAVRAVIARLFCVDNRKLAKNTDAPRINGRLKTFTGYPMPSAHGCRDGGTVTGGIVLGLRAGATGSHACSAKRDLHRPVEDQVRGAVSFFGSAATATW